MVLQYDVRVFSGRVLSAATREDAAGPVPQSLVADGRNPYTGTPAVYRFTQKALERAHAPREDHLGALCRQLVAGGAQGWKLVPLSVPRTTSAGIEIRWLEQRFARIPVFQAGRAARFDAAGRLEAIFGDHVPMIEASLPSPILDRRAAFAVASRYVGVLPQKLLGARKVWFFHRPTLRLAWELEIDLGQGEDELQVIVAAEPPGEVLFCRSLVATAARALVYRTNPGERDREPDDWPAEWLAGAALAGNNARCFLANARKPLGGLAVDGALRFEPPDPLGPEQWQVNAFAWVNRLHDRFAALGFGEAEGNLQKRNPSGRGRDGDELEVRVFPKPLARGVATMNTRRDGKICELRLGRVGGVGHTALDADVVIHEYSHAVINRLVGGPDDRAPFSAPQSLGLAEGYCDYFALSFQNHDREVEVFEIGAWISQLTGQPLRGNRYDESFPGHFGRLGEDGFSEPHNVGEIWCVALLRCNAVLGEVLGDRKKGHALGWQLVIDSLKLLPTGSDKPSFLEARDALLEALEDHMTREAMPEDKRAALRAMTWTVFAGLGLGPAATCEGASLAGVVADFGD